MLHRQSRPSGAAFRVNLELRVLGYDLVSGGLRNNLGCGLSSLGEPCQISDPQRQTTLSYVGQFNYRELALEINKIYSPHHPELIAESLGFSIGGLALRGHCADSLIQAISSLHWPADTFVGNLEKLYSM